MAYLFGQMIGAILACLPAYLFGLLVGLFLKSKEPDERAMYASMGAWLIMYVLSGFGFARNETFRFDAGLLYIPAAIIAFFMLRHHYRRSWRSDDLESGLE